MEILVLVLIIFTTMKLSCLWLSSKVKLYDNVLNRKFVYEGAKEKWFLLFDSIGQRDIVNLLLQNGASVHLAIRTGDTTTETPLEIAAKHSKWRMNKKKLIIDWLIDWSKTSIKSKLFFVDTRLHRSWWNCQRVVEKRRKITNSRRRREVTSKSKWHYIA